MQCWWEKVKSHRIALLSRALPETMITYIHLKREFSFQYIFNLKFMGSIMTSRVLLVLMQLAPDEGFLWCLMFGWCKQSIRHSWVRGVTQIFGLILKVVWRNKLGKPVEGFGWHMPTAQIGKVKIYTDAFVGVALPPAVATCRQLTSEVVRSVDVRTGAGYSTNLDRGRNHNHLSIHVSNWNHTC